MALISVRDVVQRTIRQLSQVTGTGVQLYAEERIYQYVDQTFDLLFKEQWWPSFCDWFTASLDGSTGKVTADFSTLTSDGAELVGISKNDDIQAIYWETSHRPLVRLPKRLNPFSMTGSTPRFVQLISDPAKHFVVWPLNATGALHIWARSHPGELTTDSEIDFDRDVLVYGASYQYAEDDGTNPGAINKLQQLFEIRRAQLVQAMANLPSPQNPSEASVHSEWSDLNP